MNEAIKLVASLLEDHYEAARGFHQYVATALIRELVDQAKKNEIEIDPSVRPFIHAWTEHTSNDR